MRHLIHTLRQAIPVVDRFLEVTTQTISWRSDPPSWIDVAAFDAAQAAANAPGVTSLLEMDALRTAIDLYRGDLLDGCYDEWVVTVREGFRDRYLAHLQRLSEILVVDGRSAEAIRVCRELLRNDPLREDTSRLLMGVHVVAGDRASAVRVFHECTSTLRRELAVAPAAETVAAHTALMRDAAGEAADPPSTSILVAPLIGPERELEQICRALAGRGARPGAAGARDGGARGRQDPPRRGPHGVVRAPRCAR
ncbi:MAG: transcriptional activator domain protein, partial [Ilumatobacteraceae bacterium]|nr:transcriptional activator domain protein [Ilumatobacteraceae bacterium]